MGIAHEMPNVYTTVDRHLSDASEARHRAATASSWQAELKAEAEYRAALSRYSEANRAWWSALK